MTDDPTWMPAWKIRDLIAKREVSALRRRGRAVPAHRGVYEAMALLPYDRIVPLEYDFDISVD